MAKPSQETAKISLGRGDWALQGGFGALLGDPGLRGGLLGHFLSPGVRRGSADLRALGAVLAPSRGRLGPFWPAKSILDG